MITDINSEDRLVQQTFAEHLEKVLGWESVYAYNTSRDAGWGIGNSYTMTPEMVADAAKLFNPKILYPYHYGETDTSKLVSLLKASPGIEVRIRKMK
jgi:hypothetical protein